MEKSIDKCYAKISIKWDDSKAAEKKKDWKAKTIIDWNQGEKSKEVTTIIKEAQEYILSRYGEDQNGVSADIIEIEVYSKDCVDLTIIDLPGFVRTVGKNEREELKSEISSLINDYLKNERCIILAVVPANVDFHNSQILADAKAVDPHTRRTIPVITKPDTIGEGSENSVHQLMIREMADFALGFHMVKCRSQKELDDGITLKASLKKEEIFFNVTEPWRNEPNKSLFGVAKLSDKLATLQIGRSSIMTSRSSLGSRKVHKIWIHFEFGKLRCGSRWKARQEPSFGSKPPLGSHILRFIQPFQCLKNASLQLKAPNIAVETKLIRNGTLKISTICEEERWSRLNLICLECNQNNGSAIFGLRLQIKP